ncbi:MAG: SemiSWEET family transporter [Melioribacteraceae bacterium]
MDTAEIIGYIAATVGAAIFLPQLIKTIKTKDTKALSLPTFILLNFNNLMWLTYGLLTSDSAIILSQVFVLPMCLVILFYKFRYG